jgi:beta-D-galactosyl-(1->4)-L-rhamnose phosphorylase
VFNAFEVRKCAGVRHVATHELRLHPYLFPTGLKGEPTFQPGGGGNPTLDAKNFWIDARRGIIRAPIDRIGLGGYLSLVEPWPDFQDTIEQLANEFRLLKSFHAGDKPYTAPFKVAVLTAWGELRSWIASGHFHRGLEYNELIESLAGLPVDVQFISLDDIAANGVPRGVKVIINCGREGSAWSGGHFWGNPDVVARLTGWVAQGGGFIGIAEPSAVPGRDGRFFQMAPVLGVDRDRGERLALGRRKHAVAARHFITADLGDCAPDFGRDVAGIVSTGPTTQVLATRTGPGPEFVEGSPAIATNTLGRGRGVYLSGFKFNPDNTRLIHRAIAWAAGDETGYAPWSSSNVKTECAFFPKKKKLVVINNAGEPQQTTITLADGRAKKRVSLAAHGIRILDI